MSTNRSFPPPGPGPGDPAALGRREFLRLGTAGAGLLALGAAGAEAEVVPGVLPHPAVRRLTSARHDVVVVGAGLWGSFTAYNLRKRGARVTLVDQYGPGNSRSTSGDETRGVRSTYGDREAGELWMLWAREAMKRWKQFDDEWGKNMRAQVFHTTGDLTCRGDDSDPITKRTREWWDKHKVPYQVLPVDEARKRWPVIDLKDIGMVLYEPDAGVVRARRAAQHCAAAADKLGARITVGKVKALNAANHRLEEIELDTGEKLRADYFVFALGPWMRTFFPQVLGDRMRTPMGYVGYFATPAGDERFTHPNLPSYNFPGVTGWPALPIDSRGFRVRGGRAAPPAPAAGDATAAPATARGGAGVAAGAGAAGGGGGRAGGAGGGGGGRGAGAANAPADPLLTDPDLSSRVTDETRIESMRRFLRERFPLLAASPISETRACHYESSISNDFVIDWHPEMANVLLAGAGNAEGAKFAPVIGDYVSQRVVGTVGDPAIAKRFAIPADTYTSRAAAAAAKARADSVARADSLARGRGRGGDEF